MTRHGFIWSLLAMVLALLGLPIPKQRPLSPGCEVWVHYELGKRARFDSIAAAMDTVGASSKDVIWVYPA